ncbi:RNA-directed DNA polymerase, eukaryota, reverse transcriptase zinc-binding domain protein [Tanacetum coccineum]
MVLESGSLNYRGDHVIVGCVKDFETLPNIHNVCFREGFNGIQISDLGGYWVLLEFESFQSCEKFQKHNGINSWFSSLKQWNAQFEIPNRFVWIDVEGTPLKAWPHATFNRIASKWGELIYMDESNASDKYNMRLCVKTMVPDFREDDIAQFKDGSDNHSVGIHKREEYNDDGVILDSFQSIVNEYNIVENSPEDVENFDVHMENSLENSHKQLENFPNHVKNSPDHMKNSYVHVENSPVHLENSPNLSEDPFGLEKLILESEKSAPMNQEEAFHTLKNFRSTTTARTLFVSRSRMTGPTPDSVTSVNQVTRNSDNPHNSPSLQDQILDHVSSLKALIKQHNERSRTLIEPIRQTFADEDRGDKGKGIDEGAKADKDENL